MSIATDFDNAFRLLATAKEAESRRDAHAAYNGFMAACDAFLRLRPHVTDPRTKEMLRVECATMIAKLEALKPYVARTAPPEPAAEPASRPAVQPLQPAPPAFNPQRVVPSAPSARNMTWDLPTPPAEPVLPSAPTGTPRPRSPEPVARRRLVGADEDEDDETYYEPQEPAARPQPEGKVPDLVDFSDLGVQMPGPPPGSLLDIPDAPSHTPRVPGMSKLEEDDADLEEAKLAAAALGSPSNTEAMALLEAEREARAKAEERVNRMSREIKHLRIRSGALLETEKRPATAPARGSQRRLGADVDDREVDVGEAGVTCMVPAAISATPTEYGALNCIFNSDEHGALHHSERDKCLLRCFALPTSVEESKQVDRFAAQLHGVARLTNNFSDVPTVRPVTRVFFADSLLCKHGEGEVVAVVEMPCTDSESKYTLDTFINSETTGAGGAGAGDAENHLPCGSAPWSVQSAFGKLVHTVAHLHKVGLQGCLDRRAISCSKDGEDVVVCAVRMPPSSSMAPEVQGGSAVDEAADMYTLAAWYYEAHFGTPPVLMPGRERVEIGRIRWRDDAYADRVSNFLANCLVRDPGQRLTAAEASIHPALTKSMVEDFHSNRTILQTKIKREALFECIQGMRDTTKRLRITVTRNMLLETAISQIMVADKETLPHRFHVTFAGEAGLDAGGLTCELFQQLFEGLFKPECPLFETVVAEGQQQLYLPKPLGDDPERDDEVLFMYEGIGRYLVKSIFDGHPVPVMFAPSLYKFMLSMPPNLHDLEAFDKDSHTRCMTLLETAPEDIEDLCLDFEEVGMMERDVTADNYKEYISAMVKYVLVDSRKPALQAMKKGFDSIRIVAHLQLFTCTELMALVCGQQGVKADELVARIIFEGFPAGSATPGLVRAVVRDLDSVQCKKLLVFATAQSALPTGSDYIVVRFHANAELYPTAHTCFRRIDMPGLTDAAELKRRLMFCLDNLEMAGFGNE